MLATPCNLIDLVEGDRFYFATDRSRRVWQVAEIEIVTIEMYHSSPYKTPCYHLENDNREIKKVKRNQVVMLMRNALKNS